MAAIDLSTLLAPALLTLLPLLFALIRRACSSAESKASKLLTPRLVTEAISRHHPGVVVSKVEVIKVHQCGDGTASTTDRIRLRLTFGDASPKGHGVPSEVLFKIILLSPWMRAGASLPIMRAIGRISVWLQERPPVLRLLGRGLWRCVTTYQAYFPHAPDQMYSVEARFYRHVRPELPPEVEACRVFGSIVDDRNKMYGQLLEDLSLRRARFPSAVDKCTPREVASVLEVLAALHASHWGSAPAWLPRHRSGGMADVFRDAFGFGLIENEMIENPFKAALVKPLGKTIRQLYDAVDVAQQFLESDPETLCHGDTGVHNTYLIGGGAKEEDKNGELHVRRREGLAPVAVVQGGLFDWQLAVRGSHMHDVTYYICTSMDPAERREHQEALLTGYLKSLRRGLEKRGLGDQTPTFEQCWLRYRQAPIWGLVIGWLICPPVNYGVAITAANISRTTTACKDLRTFEALGID